MRSGPSRNLTAAWVAAACAAFGAGSAWGAGWVDREGGLGQDEYRAIFAGGLNYGIVNGSEVESVDPSLGFRAGGAVPVFSRFAVSASFARNSGAVDAQLAQLLDVYFREDRRSATVEADVAMTRIGAGIRIDAFRTEPWRFRPYVGFEAVRSKIEVTVDSVDGEAPTSRVESFDSSHWGALGRAGVDVRISGPVGLDVSLTHEVLELQAGTSGITTGQAGISLRI